MRTIIKAYPGLVQSLCLLTILVLARMYWHGSLRFGFLAWNLFLAFIPLILSHQIHRVKQPIKALVYAAVWLLFYPNAAYLITDIVHLDCRSSTDFWLDLVILFGAAMIGVAIAVRSLANMEAWYTQLLPAMYSRLLTVVVLLMSGYGIYLGRVERWNSWDVVASPVPLLRDIAFQVRHPITFSEVWILSALFAAALGMAYLTLGRTRAH